MGHGTSRFSSSGAGHADPKAARRATTRGRRDGGRPDYALVASNVPNSARSASQISPIVQYAASAARIDGSRLSVPRAASRTPTRASSAVSGSRSVRSCRVRSTCRASSSGPIRRSSTSACSPASANSLTPTMIRSPLSRRRASLNAESSISPWTNPSSIAGDRPAELVDALDQLPGALFELASSATRGSRSLRAGRPCRSCLPRAG